MLFPIVTKRYRPGGNSLLLCSIACLFASSASGQSQETKSPNSVVEFTPAPIQVPDGFSVELAAGPPLVTHPTMACFDDAGRLYVGNNAGVNRTDTELEHERPNAIYRLVDRDGDGRFDTSTVFADEMTFPMGGAWHAGSLYVASPPHIWRLTDTNDDGVADEREILVSEFGFTGNAASIHGCFLAPNGRLYWTDGFHGHRITDESGTILSEREGSYLFSCRPDGSDPQIFCGGGMDNPVEIDFTPSGDVLGTVNIMYTRPREDCLVHWLHGGAYPHRERVLEEIQVTGDVLTPIHSFGHVAVSGMTRIRSLLPGLGGQHDLFVTFFNSGKVVRLNYQQKGSTYEVTEHEFLSSDRDGFHPTDVLEDADGSLLVIDTGGWFYRGCPTSQFAKPEILGGIYRVRHNAMPRLSDPRGLDIDWKNESPSDIVAKFDDERFAVRQQAIDHAVQRGAEMFDELRGQIVDGKQRVRLNSVWALTRLAQRGDLADAATAELRPALQDSAAEVRQAACNGLATSLISDADLPVNAWLVELLGDRSASVRRQAATTLGIRRAVEATAELIAGLQRDAIDRSEQHALIYALIEIDDPTAIRDCLANTEQWPAEKHAAAWRGAVLALNEIEAADLQFNELLSGFESQDPASLQVATQIAKSHPQWHAEVAELLGTWASSNRFEIDNETAGALMSAFIDVPEVAEIAGLSLRNDSGQGRASVVLGSIAGSGNVALHPSWIEPLRERLLSDEDATVAAAVSAVAALTDDEYTSELRTLFEDSSRPLPLRLGALAAIQRRAPGMAPATFERLLDIHRDSASPSAAHRAAELIGAAKLSKESLQTLSKQLRRASPSALREFLKPFRGSVDEAVASAFLDAMGSADSLLSLTEVELAPVLEQFPSSLEQRSEGLLTRLKQHQEQKMRRLHRLAQRLDEGDPQRGQKLFTSEKTKCSSCHRIAEQGTRVGPDLTSIGANRTSSDLLESILFPSASIVRDYENYQILTLDGRVLSGVLVSESSDGVEIQQASGTKVLVQRDEMESISPSPVSIMPAGLDEALSESELLDIVRYLQTQRDKRR